MVTEYKLPFTGAEIEEKLNKIDTLATKDEVAEVPVPYIDESTNHWFVGENDTGVKASGADGITPHIGENKNWFIGDIDTGVRAEGKDGVGGEGDGGADGITPHIGVNGNWFIGDIDTGVKAKGEDGKNGSDGTDGLTPHIGDNGNWWIGDEDTGVAATGPDGADGVGIKSVSQTTTSDADGGNNVFTFELTDGTTETFTVKNGSKGSTGSKGATGADGYTPTIAVATNTATDYKLKITNKSGTITTPNLKSVSFVEDATVYSTSEKVVGTWIDGKPLYQKTFVFSTPTVASTMTKLVSLSALNGDSFVSIDGLIVASNTFLPVNCHNGMYYGLTFIIDNHIAMNLSNPTLLSCPCYVTIKYTKTTDAAVASVAMLIDEYDEGVNEA